jgi:non-specific serine/threonine protein kinase
MLESVRQYAQEQLAEAGEAPAARARHAEAFADLAERAYRERIVREEAWGAALAAELDNLRAALATLRDADPERHLALAGALAWFWQAQSHLLEGREHVTAALAATSPDPPRPARARALWGAANLLSWQGDPAGATEIMEEAIRIWRALGDEAEVALALEGMGWAQLLAGHDQAACDTMEECVALQLRRGDAHLVNRARVGLAQILVALHQVERARGIAGEIVAFSTAHGDRRSEHFGHHFLADCALIERKYDEALTRYRTSLTLAQAIGDRLEMSFEVQGIAMSLAGLGDHAGALRLAGATQAEWDRLGADPHMRFWDALLEREIGAARRALDEGAAARAWAEGRALTFDECCRIALAG